MKHKTGVMRSFDYSEQRTSLLAAPHYSYEGEYYLLGDDVPHAQSLLRSTNPAAAGASGSARIPFVWREGPGLKSYFRSSFSDTSSNRTTCANFLTADTTRDIVVRFVESDATGSIFWNPEKAGLSLGSFPIGRIIYLDDPVNPAEGKMFFGG